MLVSFCLVIFTSLWPSVATKSTLPWSKLKNAPLRAGFVGSAFIAYNSELIIFFSLTVSIVNNDSCLFSGISGYSWNGSVGISKEIPFSDFIFIWGPAMSISTLPSSITEIISFTSEVGKRPSPFVLTEAVIWVLIPTSRSVECKVTPCAPEDIYV